MNLGKAKNIMKVAQICIDKYDEDIPDNIDDLVSLPGIGPKMGYLALQCAWHKNEGIGIDTHVHRICQRLNWTHKVGFSDRRTKILAHHKLRSIIHSVL